MNANLISINHIISDHTVLLSSCFNVLRNDGVYESAWDDDAFTLQLYSDQCC